MVSTYLGLEVLSWHPVQYLLKLNLHHGTLSGCCWTAHNQRRSEADPTSTPTPDGAHETPPLAQPPLPSSFQSPRPPCDSFTARALPLCRGKCVIDRANPIVRLEAPVILFLFWKNFLEELVKEGVEEE